MRLSSPVLSTLLTGTAVIVSTAISQDHLEPEPGVLAERDEYRVKIREVLADAYQGDVVLQVVFVPSFKVEEIAGIRKTKSALEAFVVSPSSSIWNTFNIWEIETGKQQHFGVDGKEIPLKENPSLKSLKSIAPSAFREIKTHTAARSITASLAGRIELVWQRMLIDARYQKQSFVGTDGETYHFSMFVLGRGIVSGKVWSPDKGRTADLVSLAAGLAEYAKGRTDEKTLAELLKPLEQRL